MRIGSLFSGYGGLDMAVEEVLGASTAWFVEFDKAPSKILAHHWPDVPNYGDVTTVDWSRVEPVDIITGGSPCQDLSHAGKRQGMTEGTRSNLWVAMREAIAQLRPSMVVWENVRGAYSAAADSEVEPCAGCVGDGSGVHLRALGRVLGDLSELGYDCRWHGLRAADVGAPHGRFRVFVVAQSAANPLRPRAAASIGHDPACGHSGPVDVADGLTLLATPQSRDYKGVPGDGFNTANLCRDVSLLPTPAVNDMGEGKTIEAWDEWTAKMQAAHGNGNGHGKSLAIEAQRVAQPLRWVDETPAGYVPPHTLVGDDSEWETCPECGCIWDDHDFDGFCMGSCGGNKCNGRQFYRQVPDETKRPVTAESYLDRMESMNPDATLRKRIDAQRRLLQTPSVSDATGGHLTRGGARSNEELLPGQVRTLTAQDWGIYADAIARWESLTRPAPAPTQPSKKGTPQLSPAFSEWLMGLPEGHVTDVPGLSRNDQLKALGNGVVPQQAAAAIRFLLTVQAAAA